MTGKLRVFVASSAEQIAAVDEIATTINKSRQLYAQPWKEKVFEFSKTYIESLEQELDQADFAIAVLTGQDITNVRGKQVNLPRDNVIFELGLFIGRLGRERCFFFVDADSGTTIASDLSGVQPVKFRQPTAGSTDTRTALKTRIEEVSAQMRALGPRSKPARTVQAERERLWRISAGFAGQWWERIRQGQDDRSALSYLTITIDELTNTPKFQAQVFDLAGGRLADWWSVTSAVMLAAKPRVLYRWEGEHEDKHGQTYGGHGVIDLDGESPQSGEGWFFDINFARVEEGGSPCFKHFRLYRCTPDEIRTMRDPTSDAAVTLVKAKVAGLKG
jgi:hypothetical protein